MGASPQSLWTIVDDVARCGEWLDFAERAEVLEGEGVGRRERLHGHWGRKVSEIDQVVTAHEPPHRLAWSHEAERLDGKPAPRFAAETHFEIALKPEGALTRVILTSRQVPAGPIRGVLMRVAARREVGRRMERSLERLAAVAERRPG